ncbi:multidrug DMT transporter permease [Betaproteobacteria bacterium]|nr:multidrug DMT transporter permease [Betaproteobacteria bacterium]GHU15811.1 multidrug DMT transporter permease [Betaproteobacteria bacterium]
MPEAPATTSSYKVGILFALFAAAGFSFKAILAKLIYRYGVDAETLLGLRMALALPCYLALGIFARRDARTRVPLSARDWLWLAGLGFCGYYLSSYLDFLGLKHISSGLERLILFLYPTLVIMISAFFLKKPLTRWTLFALTLTYLGIALAVGHDLGNNAEARHEIWLGATLVFASALTYAFYLIGNGMVVQRIGALQLTVWASTFACLFSIAQFLILRPVELALHHVWQTWALLGVMVIVSTVAPVWMLSEAIRRIGTGPVSLTSTLGPVVTIALGWVILDEPFGWNQVVGATLVIGGVWIMSRQKVREGRT